jgi:hypothetical protein
MPKAEPQKTRSLPFPTISLLALALVVIAFFGYKIVSSRQRLVSTDTTQQVLATNVVLNPKMVAPGTMVTAEAVLDKMDQWHVQHPNYHSILTSVNPKGAMISKMEVFSYTNGNNDTIVKFKGQVFALTPNLEFQGFKENGKLRVYFPRSGQLIEPDTTEDLLFMPNMPGKYSSAKDLLKVARSSFAEASADMEVATLAVKSETVKVPTALTGDIYISFRINTEGKLLGIEEQAQGQQITSNMKYLSFDREVVMRDSPVQPTGITITTNKTLMKTMQEEVQNAAAKPLNQKI